MFLKSDSVYLRALEPTDLEFLYGLENDVSLWSVSDTRSPFSRAVLQEYLKNASLDIYATRQLRLIICRHDHQQVGAIDLYEFDPAHQRAGVGLVVAQPSRGQGFATEALTCLIGYCRDLLHLHQLFCSIACDNQKSINLFEKAGFERVGRRKDWLRQPAGWVDVVEYQKILD